MHPGKTMLARCCGLLAYGYEPTSSGYPYDNAELNKRLDGMILGDKQIVVFDNINRSFGTGNNIMLSSDMDRRTLICNLDANMEHPQSRQFAFNPEHKVLEHRKAMVMAALQLLSHALQQSPVTKRAGSFEN